MSDDTAYYQLNVYYAEYQSIMKKLLSGETSPQLLDDCHSILQQLAMEARSIDDNDVKEEWMSRVRLYRSQFQTLRGDIERQQLVGDAASTNSPARQSLHNAQDMLERQNATLEAARRTMAETEQIAVDTTEELGRNRATIESSRSHVGELRSMTEQAKGLLDSMAKKRWQVWRG